jgi:hypothetical protein
MRCCHEDRSLFVTRDNEFQRRSSDSIKHIEIFLARYSEDMGYSVSDETVYEEMSYSGHEEKRSRI